MFKIKAKLGTQVLWYNFLSLPVVLYVTYTSAKIKELNSKYGKLNSSEELEDIQKQIG